MTIAPFLALVIQVLESFATRSTTTIDDQALRLLKAIQASPAMMEWLDSWIPVQADLPPGAQNIERLPPNVEQFVSPDQIAKLIAMLQMLVELYRQFKPLFKTST